MLLTRYGVIIALEHKEVRKRVLILTGELRVPPTLGQAQSRAGTEEGAWPGRREAQVAGVMGKWENESVE